MRQSTQGQRKSHCGPLKASSIQEALGSWSPGRRQFCGGGQAGVSHLGSPWQPDLLTSNSPFWPMRNTVEGKWKSQKKQFLGLEEGQEDSREDRMFQQGLEEGIDIYQERTG